MQISLGSFLFHKLKEYEKEIKRPKMRGFVFSSKPLAIAIIMFVAALLAAVSTGVDARIHYRYLRRYRYPCPSFCRKLNCTSGHFKLFSFDCECTGCDQYSNYTRYASMFGSFLPFQTASAHFLNGKIKKKRTTLKED